MSMIGISQHLIRTSLIPRSGGLFLTPTRSLTCSIIRSLFIVKAQGFAHRVEVAQMDEDDPMHGLPQVLRTARTGGTCRLQMSSRDSARLQKLSVYDAGSAHGNK